MSRLLAFNENVRRETTMDKPEHISLAAGRVLAGIKRTDAKAPASLASGKEAETRSRKISGYADAFGAGGTPIRNDVTETVADTRPERGRT
jgi:hypothetical protein